MERDVLKILLQGKCGIIVVLARACIVNCDVPKPTPNNLYEKGSVIRVYETCA